MRVLVCGGRDFTDFNWMHDELVRLHHTLRFTHLIHGGAKGADKLAGMWAAKHFLPCTVFKAEWDKFGKKAGYLRNKRMLDEGQPDLVIAFPGGVGTRMMIDLAEKADVSFMEFSRE